MIFADEIGNETKPLRGTAFWIRHNEKVLLVTNRHNYDATMHKDMAQKKLIKFRILMRKKTEDGSFLQETKWADVDLNKIDGWIHSEADVAVLDVKSIPPGVGLSAINSKEIADREYFENEANFLDPVFFIGYPQNWYDSAWNSPIARLAHIASNPSRTFSNDALLTQDTILVNGLSFGGSSGSIVIFSGEGVQEIETTSSPYREPKCVGIMSGHFNELKSSHSGLSYFTRSSAIHEVLRQEKIQSIKNCIHTLRLNLNKSKSFEI